MSDTSRPDPENPGAEPGPHANEPAGAGETAAPDAMAEFGLEPGPEQLKAIIAALQGDLDKQQADLKTEKLRHLADMDNLRKRLEREKDETAKFAISKFASDLIGVADNFERALAAVPAGAADNDPALQSLAEGVGMIERELKTVLDRHGVKRIWPEGEIFNPHQHQAVMQQDNADVPPGTILQIFQAGYLIGERVVRPAVVVVAKGGPKTPKPEAPPEPQPIDLGPSDSE